jgi:hypothetical protein
VVIPDLQIRNNFNNNRELRTQFLLGQIDETRFRRVLQKQEKANTKNGEILLVYQMFTDTIADIMQRFVEQANPENFGEFLKEFHGLRTYTNNCLDKISKRYNNKVPKFNETWQMY